MDEISTQLAGSKMLNPKLVGFLGAGSTERESEDEFGQEYESESDEEPIEEDEAEQETTAVNEGRRYPLRDRRVPRRFPDRGYVLLTDEGNP